MYIFYMFKTYFHISYLKCKRTLYCLTCVAKHPCKIKPTHVVGMPQHSSWFFISSKSSVIFYYSLKHSSFSFELFLSILMSTQPVIFNLTSQSVTFSNIWDGLWLLYIAFSPNFTPTSDHYKDNKKNYHILFTYFISYQFHDIAGDFYFEWFREWASWISCIFSDPEIKLSKLLTKLESLKYALEAFFALHHLNPFRMRWLFTNLTWYLSQSMDDQFEGQC